ncbi:MAG: aldose 1-epimerase [Ramlibacter sp.]
MSESEHPVVWLRYAGQRLGLVPSLGGSVAAWQLERGHKPLDLWRPWDGVTPDLYQMASFAMVPWSNRISGGGFTHDGHFHAMQPNRHGEAYPIHGDGWLQPWVLTQPAADTLVMTLESHQFHGNPHAYRAVQTFRLVADGLDQELRVRHLGSDPLPYGLGVHPWFPRTPATRITAPVQGVWLSGHDPLPVSHTSHFPPGWDLNDGVAALGTLIDNGYTGWGGTARIAWPEAGRQITVAMPGFDRNGGTARHFCLIYRPPEGPAFCFEPISQPIDAFHLPETPGLRTLRHNEEFALAIQWRVETWAS